MHLLQQVSILPNTHPHAASKVKFNIFVSNMPPRRSLLKGKVEDQPRGSKCSLKGTKNIAYVRTFIRLKLPQDEDAAFVYLLCTVVQIKYTNFFYPGVKILIFYQGYLSAPYRVQKKIWSFTASSLGVVMSFVAHFSLTLYSKTNPFLIH